ncbi:N-acetylmuramoyl-L-alanine amidase family protein [Vallitalea sp.]|uniref:N-acetylmuramoyl-L-alanine amidase family protein n=1 Tax=Vallitalea sp. TaxID=1882829 RepID=UPI0025CEE32A|nr:N-acetylmuramoyl-L-alanine amidase [Vallitalea sp.]MCT4688330.1 N-acetylmuramoyl-L-alanine amidase [Vallitalea sp.]
MARKIDTKVKINNVKLIIDRKVTIEEVAYKLGVSTNNVRYWLKVYMENQKKKRMRLIAGIVVLLIISIPIILFTIFHKKAKPVSENVVPDKVTEETEKQNTDKKSIYNGMGTVFIDPGHGFSDSGTEAPDKFGFKLIESEVVLKIAKRVVEILEANDYDVVMSRTENYDEKQEDKLYKISLNERVRLAKESKADVFISLHVNAYEESNNVNGYDLYYCEKDDKYNEEVEKFANKITDKFIKKTGIEKIRVHKEPRRSSYQVTRQTTMPSLLFEMGYATNKKDAKRLLDNEFLENTAMSIAEGIMGYLTEIYSM